MKKRIIFLMTAVIMIFNLIPAMGVSASMSIEIGEYVQMGTYYGQPILWRCVDIDENGPLMLSDKIICIKPFDAFGTNTSGSHGRGYYYYGTQGYYRQQYGSDYWADSNMRCWLNSTATAGNVVWACGNPPDESHVWNGYNEYDDEAGFLTNFTQSERNAMKTVTQKSILNGYEYSSGSTNTINSNYHRYDYSIGSVVQNYNTAFSEQVTDTMFLLDVKQVNEVYNNRSILGSDYYIGEPTAECVANSEHKYSSLSTGKKWYYWLRSPNADNSSGDVRSVYSGGYVYSSDHACDGGDGVRPAFYLNLSSASVSGGAGTLNSPYTVVGGYRPEDYNYLPPTTISNGNFVFNSEFGDGKASFDYSDNYFYNDSYTYNHNLAKMSMRLAASAFATKNTKTQYKNAEALLTQMGYDEIDWNDCYEQTPERNSIGVIIGNKKIAYPDGNYTVIAIAIRGQGYKAEWGGNFNVGDGKNHAGFEAARNQVREFLEEYVRTKEISGKVKIWITGYSRAAATANLTAAYLDENPNGWYDEISLDRGDIFAYCFETPAGVVDPANDTGIYNNIFSIVNQHDFVPMVAMRKWGYDRYGITKYLPTAQTNSNYGTDTSGLKGKMLDYFEIYCNSDYIIDDFCYYYSFADVETLQKEGMGAQGVYLEKIMDQLANAIGSPTNYKNKYQEAIEYIGAEIVGKKKTDEFLSGLGTELAKRGILLVGEATWLVNPLTAWVGSTTGYLTVRSALVSTFDKLDISLSKASIDSIVDLIFDIGIDNVVTFIQNKARIVQAHYPELCMAWLDAIEEKDFRSNRLRTLYLNCPVDLEVYDSNDNLVAAVYDNVPQEIEGSSIVCYIDANGQKVVYLPQDEEYRIEVIATDDGEVTYTVQEQNTDIGETKVINYNKMAMKKDDILTGTAENLSETEVATYSLTSNSITVEEPEIIENATPVAVTPVADGNGNVTGGGLLLKGEYAQLTAIPLENETFLGWYNGETLISSDATYRFQVAEAVTLTAKFTENTCEIAFFSTDDDVVYVKRILKGNRVAFPTINQNENYIILGVYTDKECLNLADENTIYSEDIILYLDCVHKNNWVQFDEVNNKLVVYSPNAMSNVQLMVALYEEEKLTELRPNAINLLEGENVINNPLTNMGTADTLKIFAWDGLSTLKPVFKNCVVELK